MKRELFLLGAALALPLGAFADVSLEDLRMKNEVVVSDSLGVAGETCVTEGNFPNTVTQGNFPDTVTQGNFPDTVTQGNFPTSGGNIDVNAVALPSPQISE